MIKAYRLRMFYDSYSMHYLFMTPRNLWISSNNYYALLTIIYIKKKTYTNVLLPKYMAYIGLLCITLIIILNWAFKLYWVFSLLLVLTYNETFLL